MSWIAVAVGAGAGLLKSVAVDAPRASRERKLASETQRYAPWTGLTAQPIHEADPFGSMLQFGATGASLGQNMQNAEAQNALTKAQTDRLNSGGSMLGGGRALPVAAAQAPVQPGPDAPWLAKGAQPKNAWERAQAGSDYNPWTF